MKLAPIDAAMQQESVDHVIIHTGQHYDPLLSDVFFEDLNIAAPNEHLEVGSASHARQTGAILAALDNVLPRYNPDWVLVYGDTNSTLAAALAAVKLHLPVAHLEAGLRSFNRRMPEEHNRVLTDHASDLLLAPTQVAVSHLHREGLAERTRLVGDVMTDVLMKTRDEVAATEPSLLRELGLKPGEFSLATIHRAENTDDPARLEAVIRGLGEVDHPVVVLAHPRLVARAREIGLDLGSGNLRVHAPLPYPQLVTAATTARGIITDSGGLQKEAFLLRVPCTTIRTETEWTETVDLGWNVLVEPGPELVAAASRPRPADTDATPYGDGRAAFNVVRELAGSRPAG